MILKDVQYDWSAFCGGVNENHLTVKRILSGSRSSELPFCNNVLKFSGTGSAVID